MDTELVKTLADAYFLSINCRVLSGSWAIALGELPSQMWDCCQINSRLGKKYLKIVVSIFKSQAEIKLNYQY
jgi:hypothetical protein